MMRVTQFRFQQKHLPPVPPGGITGSNSDDEGISGSGHGNAPSPAGPPAGGAGCGRNHKDDKDHKDHKHSHSPPSEIKDLESAMIVRSATPPSTPVCSKSEDVVVRKQSQLENLIVSPEKRPFLPWFLWAIGSKARQFLVNIGAVDVLALLCSIAKRLPGVIKFATLTYIFVGFFGPLVVSPNQRGSDVIELTGPKSDWCFIVCTFHGINSDARRAWIKDGEEEPWLVSYFSSHFPCARVISLDYGTDMNPLMNTPAGVDTVASVLLQNLLHAGVNGSTDIYFAAHSNGGLVLISALGNAFKSNSTSERGGMKIINATEGIIFYGVPMMGSKHGDLLYYVVRRGADLQTVSATGISRIKEFEKVRETKRFKIVCVAESYETCFGPLCAKIVEETSAKALCSANTELEVPLVSLADHNNVAVNSYARDTFAHEFGALLEASVVRHNDRKNKR